MDQVFEKYTEKGAYHWDATVDARPLRACPQLLARYQIPLDLLKRRLRLGDARGLDIGCGDGMLVYTIRRAGGNIEGLDYSEEGLRLARQKLAEHGVSGDGLQQGSVYDLPYDDASLDYVTAVELIEHLDDATRMLKEVSRVLKPGGVFICTTPNADRIFAPGEVIDPYHEHEFTAGELRSVLKRFFGDATVRGCAHSTLNGVYRNTVGSRAAKLLNAAGVNVFRHHLSRQMPRRRWTTLVGWAVKPSITTMEDRVALHHFRPKH